MSNSSLPDKWIVGLDPAGAVASAAPDVLQRRLDAVADRVRDVIKSSGRDDEAVHQLRVSTRRAQATMLSFKPWLKKSRRQRVKKVLRRLREAAGLVRMCDVHRGLLCAALIDSIKTAPALDRAVNEFALLMLARERETALARLVRAARRVPAKRLTTSAHRLIRTINDDIEPCDPSRVTAAPAAPAERPASLRATVRAAGHAALANIACEFQVAGKTDLGCRENLHQLRLCGKRLRYALEIFGAAEEDPQPLAQLAEHLAALQERLGEVNDHHEVSERIQRYADTAAAIVTDPNNPACVLPEACRALADRFEQRSATLSADFLAWWHSAQAGDFHRLVDMLAGREALLHEPADDPPPPEVVILANSNNPAKHVEAVAGSIATDDDAATPDEHHHEDGRPQ